MSELGALPQRLRMQITVVPIVRCTECIACAQVGKCMEAQCCSALICAECTARMLDSCHGRPSDFVCPQCQSLLKFKQLQPRESSASVSVSSISAQPVSVRDASGSATRYPCKFPDCPAVLSSRSSRARHQRIHTDERPYACQQCTSRFVEKSALTRHERTHTDERKYLCIHCQKGFSDRSTRRRHELTQHAEKP